MNSKNTTSSDTIDWTEIVIPKPTPIPERIAHSFSDWINNNTTAFCVILIGLIALIIAAIIILVICLKRNFTLRKENIAIKNTRTSAQDTNLENIERDTKNKAYIEQAKQDAKDSTDQANQDQDNKLYKDALETQTNNPTEPLESNSVNNRNENLKRILRRENQTAREKLVGCSVLITALRSKYNKADFHNQIPTSRDTFSTLINFITLTTGENLLSKLLELPDQNEEENNVLVKTEITKLSDLLDALKDYQNNPGTDIDNSNHRIGKIIETIDTILNLPPIVSISTNNTSERLYNEYLKTTQEQIQYWINESYATYKAPTHRFNREELKILDKKKIQANEEFTRIENERKAEAQRKVEELIAEETAAKLVQEQRLAEIEATRIKVEKIKEAAELAKLQQQTATSIENTTPKPTTNQEQFDNITTVPRRRRRHSTQSGHVSSNNLNKIEENPESTEPRLTNNEEVAIRRSLSASDINKDTVTTFTTISSNATTTMTDDKHLMSETAEVLDAIVQKIVDDSDEEFATHLFDSEPTTRPKPAATGASTIDVVPVVRTSRTTANIDTLIITPTDTTRTSQNPHEIAIPRQEQVDVKEFKNILQHAKSVDFEDTEIQNALRKINESAKIILENAADQNLFTTLRELGIYKTIGQIRNTVNLVDLENPSRQIGLLINFQNLKENDFEKTRDDHFRNLMHQNIREIQKETLKIFSRLSLIQKDRQEKSLQHSEEKVQKTKEATSILKSVIEFLKSDAVKNYIKKDIEKYNKIYERETGLFSNTKSIIVSLESDLQTIENSNNNVRQITLPGVVRLIDTLDTTSTKNKALNLLSFAKKQGTAKQPETYLEELYEKHKTTAKFASGNNDANNNYQTECVGINKKLHQIIGKGQQDAASIVSEASSQPTTTNETNPSENLNLRGVQELVRKINELSSEINSIQNPSSLSTNTFQFRSMR